MQKQLNRGQLGWLGHIHKTEDRKISEAGTHGSNKMGRSRKIWDDQLHFAAVKETYFREK